MPDDRVPWIERRFDFNYPATRHPEFVDRLRTAPDRAAALVAGFPALTLEARPGGAWSIKENLGHLADLETLWAGRLEDYLSGATELRPADMSNRATHLAGHNSRDIGRLLHDFAERRNSLVIGLNALEPADFSRSAYHARLGTQMRLVDTLHFIAEHDDHHIETIRRLTL